MTAYGLRTHVCPNCILGFKNHGASRRVAAHRASDALCSQAHLDSLGIDNQFVANSGIFQCVGIRQEIGRWTNNRAENSHLAIRKRQQRGFKSKASAQRLLTTQASIYNTFYTAHHLISRRTLKNFRAAAHDIWSRQTCAYIPAG